MNLKTPIGELVKIGPVFSQRLSKLGIKTLEDLIYHFPFRYDTFPKINEISQVKANKKINLVGKILTINNIKRGPKRTLTVARIEDGSGNIEAIWFNQPYITKVIKPGMVVSIYGKTILTNKRIKLVVQTFEVIHQLFSNNNKTDQLVNFIPVYPETEGLSSRWIRKKISECFNIIDQIPDFLPEEIKNRHKLKDLKWALEKIHFPKNHDEIIAARKRLAFDELFLLQLIAQIKRAEWQSKMISKPLKLDYKLFNRFYQSLPFELTNAQKRAIEEIIADLKKSVAANRLLEGDVGCGKTVVAAAAAYLTFLNDLVTLIAAPTEILAIQHQNTLKELLEPLGVTIGIWTAKKKIPGDIICGTHAIISSFKPKDKEVGLVVVDEQHRFGVAQRAKFVLNQTKKFVPHLLTMTATPIPRTLALTIYGDLDLSILNEAPKNRPKVETFLVPNHKRDKAYEFIKNQIAAGRQAFVITPFIDVSETAKSVRAAKLEFERLKHIFKDGISLGLLHGKLKSDEKEAVMKKFKNNQIQILVATPLVEVGIDIPNANVILIESAERFGLAQLHQLRGRVGRGSHKSYCLLFTDSNSTQAIRRLKIMEKIQVGFELAEKDLEMRGPGEFFGLKQSGFINLKIANLSDSHLIQITQKEAKLISTNYSNLKKYPNLLEKINSFKVNLTKPN